MVSILAINPGATSTKVGVFMGEQPTWKATLEHRDADEERALPFEARWRRRREAVLAALAKEQIPLAGLSAVVARGGRLKPLRGGAYLVNDRMLRDLEDATKEYHPSCLGAPMARDIAAGHGVPAFIVDPISVDELEPEARLSGLPELPRVSVSHALNSKAVAKKVARQLGRRYQDVNLVVAHLGSGVSVSSHRRGRMIDVNDSKEEGPFAVDRCGTLPAYSLARLCYSGQHTEKEMLSRIMGSGGLFAHLGTRDLREVERRAIGGDVRAALALRALAYQVAKAIGAMAAVLCGAVDRVVLTGGMAHSRRLIDEITPRVSFIAPVVVIPGEEELEALAAGALRVLEGEEEALTYE